MGIPPGIASEHEGGCSGKSTDTRCNSELTTAEMDASGASEGIEDNGNMLMNLQNTSERECEHVERRSREHSPGRTQDELNEPDDLHSYREGPQMMGMTVVVI
jgi:hypothetical protein